MNKFLVWVIGLSIIVVTIIYTGRVGGIIMRNTLSLNHIITIGNWEPSPSSEPVNAYLCTCSDAWQIGGGCSKGPDIRFNGEGKYVDSVTGAYCQPATAILERGTYKIVGDKLVLRESGSVFPAATKGNCIGWSGKEIAYGKYTIRDHDASYDEFNGMTVKSKYVNIYGLRINNTRGNNIYYIQNLGMLSVVVGAITIVAVLIMAYYMVKLAIVIWNGGSKK